MPGTGDRDLHFFFPLFCTSFLHHFEHQQSKDEQGKQHFFVNDGMYGEVSTPQCFLGLLINYPPSPGVSIAMQSR